MDVVQFQKEIFLQCYVLSTVWSIALHLTFILPLGFLTRLDVWHPLLSLIGFAGVVFSFSCFGICLIIGIVIACMSLQHSKAFSLTYKVHVNRLCILWSLIRPEKVLDTFIHAILSGIIARCSLKFLDDSATFPKACINEECKSYFNEKHLFIILHGLVTGCLYSFSYYYHYSYCIGFPSVQQLKFLAVKSKVCGLAWMSLCDTFRNLRWFYIAYFVFGSYTRLMVADTIGLQPSSEQPLNSVQGMLDVRLLLNALLTGAAVRFVWNAQSCLVQVYATEGIEFPVESVLQTDIAMTLPHILTLANLPLLQHLAYLDLCQLAQHSPSRRREIFSITQPGGHPRNWDTISLECLTLLEAFTANVNTLGVLPRPTTQTLSSDGWKNISQMSPGSNIARPTSSFVADNRINASFRSPFPEMNASVVGGPPPLRFISYHPAKFRAVIITYLGKMKEMVKNLAVIKYFLAELPEAKGKELFLNSQLVIWAVEALCRLVSASFHEDKYGVVQKSLPRIMVSLLDLHMALERHTMGLAVLKKASRDAGFCTRGAYMKQSLRMAVTSGLYHIVCTFGVHLRGISLSGEHWRRLQQFVDFKE